MTKSKRRMKRCRHMRHVHFGGRLADEFATTSGFAWDASRPLLFVAVVYVHCRDCGAMLPLGPANDDDPDVQVEIRAAMAGNADEVPEPASHGYEVRDTGGAEPDRSGYGSPGRATRRRAREASGGKAVTEAQLIVLEFAAMASSKELDGVTPRRGQHQMFQRLVARGWLFEVGRGVAADDHMRDVDLYAITDAGREAVRAKRAEQGAKP